MEEKEQTNPIEGETYTESSGNVETQKEKNFGWGLYVLIGGCIWAVFELIKSILYFF